MNKFQNMKIKFIVVLMMLYSVGILGQNTYEVIATELNVRASNNKESNAIGKVKKGDVISVESFEGDWALVSIVNDGGEEQKGYVSAKYIQPARESENTSNKRFLSDGQRIVLIGAGIFGLICYIIAFTKVRRGEMTIIVNWTDVALLVATFVLPIIGGIIAYNANNSNSLYYFITGCVLAGLCFLSSLVWSIMANNDNYYHAFLSVFAKIFLVFIALLILWAILGHWAGRNNAKNKIKKEGYTMPNRMEYRKYSEKMSMSAKILDYLVISLIGSHK